MITKLQKLFDSEFELEHKENFKEAFIQVIHTRVQSSNEAIQKIRSFLPAEGWIMFTDTIARIFKDTTLPSDSIPLKAELVNGFRNIQLVQSGSEFIFYEIEYSDTNKEDFIHCISIEDRYYSICSESTKDSSSYKDKEIQVYENYWTLQKDTVSKFESYRPYISRLVSYEKISQ